MYSCRNLTFANFFKFINSVIFQKPNWQIDWKISAYKLNSDFHANVWHASWCICVCVCVWYRCVTYAKTYMTLLVCSHSFTYDLCVNVCGQSLSLAPLESRLGPLYVYVSLHWDANGSTAVLSEPYSIWFDWTLPYICVCVCNMMNESNFSFNISMFGYLLFYK